MTCLEEQYRRKYLYIFSNYNNTPKTSQSYEFKENVPNEKAMMKLDALDEMKGLIKCPWSAVDTCDYTKWIQRDYDG
jgi:hypothetical protein